jgi:DNA-binding MarR family transcriptional regulator
VLDPIDTECDLGIITDSPSSPFGAPAPPALLTPRLEATRRALLLVNRIGVRSTSRLVDAGLGALSSNVTIAVLSQLDANGPSRPRELLPATKLTRGGLSNLLNRLESAGLIARVYGGVSGDRRGATVELAGAGADALSAINGIVTTTLVGLRAELAELATSIDTITTPDASSIPVTASPTHHLGLLSLAGAAIVDALADVDPDDPTPSKTAVVLASAAEPGHTQPSELIEATGLSSGGVSQLLNRLEDGDLIHRRKNLPPDRRAVRIELTARGHGHLVRQLTGVADHFALLRAVTQRP